MFKYSNASVIRMLHELCTVVGPTCYCLEVENVLLVNFSPCFHLGVLNLMSHSYLQMVKASFSFQDC